MGAPLIEYRAFLLNAEGRICKVVELRAEGEQTARRELEELSDARHGFELWSGKNLITRVAPEETEAASSAKVSTGGRHAE